MKLPQFSPILCGWFFTSCPPNKNDNIPNQIVKKQGRGEDRLLGRLVNQGSSSFDNNQDRRDSETLLGQFVSYPDEINQHSEFGIVRTSEPPQLTDSGLRGHFTQTDWPSKTDTKQEQIVYEQEAEEYSFQEQTFQDYGQDGFQPPHPDLQLDSPNIAHQTFSAPRFVQISPP
jgi:hypothetical protein